jgi:uncharacterized protein YciI
MKFAAIFDYTADKDKIAQVRPVHRQYLTSLRDRGQLVIAGPFTDDSGSLIVYEAATKEDAEKLIQADPFQQHGIFQRFQLRPWNPVMANRELLPA